MGQTYPLPDVGEEWAEQHLAAQDERVGPYPEQLESTLASHPTSAGADSAESPTDSDGGSPPRETLGPTPPAGDAGDPQPSPERPPKYEVQVDYEAPAPKDTDLTDSPVRRIVGRRIQASTDPEADRPVADTLRELAFLDRINEIAPADQQQDDGARLPRLYDEDYAVLTLLDRAASRPPASSAGPFSPTKHHAPSLTASSSSTATA